MSRGLTTDAVSAITLPRNLSRIVTRTIMVGKSFWQMTRNLSAGDVDWAMRKATSTLSAARTQAPTSIAFSAGVEP